MTKTTACRRTTLSGKLKAIETSLDDARKTADGEGFGEARNTLQQNVSAAEKTDQDPLKHSTVANDDPIHFG
jgi:hypothetical protein